MEGGSDVPLFPRSEVVYASLLRPNQNLPDGSQSRSSAAAVLLGRSRPTTTIFPNAREMMERQGAREKRRDAGRYGTERMPAPSLRFYSRKCVGEPHWAMDFVKCCISPGAQQKPSHLTFLILSVGRVDVSECHVKSANLFVNWTKPIQLPHDS
jgi:hypothetical protein